MFQLRYLLAAFAAAAVGLITPNMGQAGFSITYSINGGAEQTAFFDPTADGGSPPAFEVAGLELRLSGSSNLPGSGIANVSATTIAATVVGAIAPGTTLRITTTAFGFTNIAAGSDVFVKTTASASILEGTSNQYSLINGEIVAGNSVFLNGPGAGNDTDPSFIPTNPFSVGNVVFITFTGGGYRIGETVANVNVDTQVFINGNGGGGEGEPIPAPPALILALTSLPFLGFMRRRLLRTDASVAA